MKTIFAFLGGAFTGSCLCYFVMKKKVCSEIEIKYEALQEEAYEKYREELEARIVEKVNSLMYKDTVDKEVEKGEPVRRVVPLTLVKEPMESIYHKAVKDYGQHKAALQGEYVDDNILLGRLVDAEIEVDGPYVISLSEFTEDKQHYDKISWCYYEGDDVLCDENEEPISEGSVEETVGDALVRFGDGSDDENIVYVRNDKISCDYEISRVNASFSEVVLGIIPEDRYTTKKRGEVDDECKDES